MHISSTGYLEDGAPCLTEVTGNELIGWDCPRKDEVDDAGDGAVTDSEEEGARKRDKRREKRQALGSPPPPGSPGGFFFFNGSGKGTEQSASWNARRRQQGISRIKFRLWRSNFPTFKMDQRRDRQPRI